MKRLQRLFIAMLLVFGVSMTANSQVRFGVKAGMAVNKLSFDESILDSDNRNGFTGGLMAEFNLPILNLGVDASLLYVQRSTKTYSDEGETLGTNRRHYIDIPINLKWKLGLPVVKPFVTTGPDFSFLCSKQNFKDAVENRKFDFAWNVGIGVDILSKVQVAASYGFGITNSSESSLQGEWKDIKGKNRFWTVTVAYMF